MRGHWLVLLISLLVPAMADAQGGDASSIEGYVYYQGGNPLPGVKITARSPTQTGGARIAYSNGEGFFRLPALSLGVFEVSATALKMQSHHERGVTVGITGAVDLSIVMAVQAQEHHFVI